MVTHELVLKYPNGNVRGYYVPLFLAKANPVVIVQCSVVRGTDLWEEGHLMFADINTVDQTL